MGVIIPEDAFQATYVFSTTGTDHRSTFSHGVLRGPTGPSDPAAMAEALYDAWLLADHPGQQDWLHDSWFFEGVSVTLMDETGPIVGEFFSRVNGAYSNSALPLNCTALVRKRTALGGKKGRGRVYLPAGVYIGEDQVTAAGAIDSAPLSFLQDAFDLWLADLTADDIIPALLHSDGAAATIITQFSVESKIATQRRRLR